MKWNSLSEKIHSYTKKYSADAPVRNRAKDINLDFELWDLKIEFFQQETQT